MQPPVFLLFVFLAFGARVARSQEAASTPTRSEITVAADRRMAQGVTGRGPFLFAFSRPLLPTDGTLAVIVDDVDLAAFVSIEGTGVRLASRRSRRSWGRGAG